MVGVERFELPTSCSQSRRATGLRYTPKERGFSLTKPNRPASGIRRIPENLAHSES